MLSYQLYPGMKHIFLLISLFIIGVFTFTHTPNLKPFSFTGNYLINGTVYTRLDPSNNTSPIIQVPYTMIVNSDNQRILFYYVGTTYILRSDGAYFFGTVFNNACLKRNF